MNVNFFRKYAQGMTCSVCGKPLPNVHRSKRNSDLLCYEHFLETDEGKAALEDGAREPVEGDVPRLPLSFRGEQGGYAGSRLVTAIHFHNSGGDSGNAASFRAYHISLGWGNIAYHAVICNGNGGADGEIQWGKSDEEVAYSVGNYLNDTAWALVMVGNFTQYSPTQKQWAAATGIARQKKDAYGVIKEKVLGHREARANSECPGFSDAMCQQFRNDVFNYAKPIPIPKEEEDDDMSRCRFQQSGLHTWVNLQIGKTGKPDYFAFAALAEGVKGPVRVWCTTLENGKVREHDTKVLNTKWDVVEWALGTAFGPVWISTAAVANGAEPPAPPNALVVDARD